MAQQNIQYQQDFDITSIYQELIDGQYSTYNELVNVVKRLINLVPELSTSAGDDIDNYSQKELEQIVKSFINHVQKQQLNNDELKTNRKNNLIYDQKFKWENKFKDYYAEHKNNLQDVTKLLNVGNNQEQTYKKVYQALYALDLLEDIVYNNQKHQFEYIRQPNKSGTAAKKLTLSLFNKLIQLKIDNEDVKHRLHPNVRETGEYKFIKQVLQKVSLVRKQRNVDKFINKNIKQRTKPSPDQISKRLFNKIKNVYDNTKRIQDGLINTDRGIQNYTKRIENNQTLIRKPIQKDRFIKTQQKYGSFKVLDPKSDVQQTKQNLTKQVDQVSFFKGLKYIPQKEQDIIQTQQANQYQNYIKNKGFGIIKKEE